MKSAVLVYRTGYFSPVRQCEIRESGGCRLCCRGPRLSPSPSGSGPLGCADHCNRFKRLKAITEHSEVCKKDKCCIKNLLFLPIKEHRRYLRSEEVEEVFLGQTQLLQSPAVGGREGGVQLPAPDMIIIITLIIITITVIT